jgi:hypothetical protein
MTSLVGQHLRSGLSRPRVVETSDIFYISYSIQKIIAYGPENNKYLVTCMFFTVSLLPKERSGLVVHGVLNPFIISQKVRSGAPKDSSLNSVLL